MFFKSYTPPLFHPLLLATVYSILSADKASLQDNPYLEPIADNTRDTLTAYIDNFEEWVAAVRSDYPDNELGRHYDFDRRRIDETDYAYIDPHNDGKTANGMEHGSFNDYDIYFFDTESGTLYRFAVRT